MTEIYSEGLYNTEGFYRKEDRVSKGSKKKISVSSLEESKDSADGSFSLAEPQHSPLARLFAGRKSSFYLLGWRSSCTSYLGGQGTSLPVGVSY